MVDKKLVATTVSSRETGLERRAETSTTSSHEDKKTENKIKKTEFTSLSKARTARKSSLREAKKKKQKKNIEKRQQEAKAKRCMELAKRKQCKSKLPTPGRRVQDAAAAAARSRLRLKVKKSSKNSIYCLAKEHEVHELE